MTLDSSRAPDSGSPTGGRWGDTLGVTGGVYPGQSSRRHLRVWWRRRRAWLTRTSRRAWQTVTPAGWCVLGHVVVAGTLGLLYGWVEALFVAATCAILLVLALPFLLGSRAYLVHIRVDRVRLVAGAPIAITIEVDNSGVQPALPATAELPIGDALRKVAVPYIPGHGHAELEVSIDETSRGVFDVGPLTLSRRDPLALLRREVKWRDTHRVHVHPQTVALPPGSAGLVRDLEGVASRRITDADLSFHEVREYVPGDALRHVHWKSTAKTGTLMVRQYEETQTARAAVLFDADRRQYSSNEEFELGVSAAASVSLQATREGRERFIASAWTPGRLRPSIDGLEEIPSTTSEQLLDAWAALEAAEDDAPPIEWLARNLAESRRPLSVVTVVTGSKPEAARLRRISASFPSDVTIVVVRCEWFAEPVARLLDGRVFYTIGALRDLPQLQLRGGVA